MNMIYMNDMIWQFSYTNCHFESEKVGGKFSRGVMRMHVGVLGVGGVVDEAGE